MAGLMKMPADKMEETMAITVDVAKDPSKIKSKFIMNFTKRQTFCFSLAVIFGLPAYFLMRNVIGTDGAALLMMAVMLPFFFVAMYEKDGIPAEKYLMQMIRMKYIRPGIRRYSSCNIYEKLKHRKELEREVERLEEKKKHR